MGRLASWIAEMWPMPYIPRSVSLRANAAALRTTLSESLFGRPYGYGTTVDYALARSLYRNDHPQYNLGAGFVRPIVDLTVEYMGLPYVTTDDGNRDTFLNEAIHDHWAEGLQEVFRNAIRDSKTVVRFRQPRIDNPLFTEEDRVHGTIETIPPELADITFDPTDPELVLRAVITHYIDFDERTQEEILRGDAQRVREHEIHEIITAESYRFYDKSDNKELVSWQTRNTWGFVPVWPKWNEWDSTLGNGQSDFESALPFIKAFHDVLEQALRAHKYHSVPKAKLKLKDVANFLRNNYPDTLDAETGRPKAGSKIAWTGKEVFLMDSEEDMDFVEARSVLGDSATLLDFLIDCIAIASETPKWALLKTDAANKDDASIAPFEKKIARKRVMFTSLVVMLCKMALAAKGQSPVTVRCTWPAIRLSDLAAKGQAVQQIIMSMDVATQHGWVADQTVIQILGTLFPEIASPEVEQRLAANNVVPEVAAPAPQSDTQGAQPNGNGGGSKAAAKRALATTAASNS